MYKPAVAIVGAGKVGTALAAVLHNAGYTICAVASKSLLSAERLAAHYGALASDKAEEVTIRAEVIFITTPDDYISVAVEEIHHLNGFKTGQLVYHTSGALGAEVLLPAKESGAYIGSIHPLQTLAGTTNDKELLTKCFFAVAGDSEAVMFAKELIGSIGGSSIYIGDDCRALYHAAACMASNYLVAIMHAASAMLKRMGLTSAESIQVLMPLVQATLRNVDAKGTAGALTGPISRGDVKTVERHFDSLKATDELAIYAELAKYTAAIAVEKGTIVNKQAEEILNLAKNKTKGEIP